MNGARRSFLRGCALLLALTGFGPQSAPAQNYVERFDTLYNSLTIERSGTVVEMRARSRRGEYLESAVDLADPLRLVVPYTRTLYAGLLVAPDPQRVLMIGLGGGGFHRLFHHAFPDTTLHSVELDDKVRELAESRMGFRSNERLPVTIMDGRLFVKRNRETWDWIILDAFRGGFVPPHLKTQEFYEECAARLGERGVFITNLHPDTELYLADIKTLQSVFRQVALFRTANRGNVIALGVKYRSPAIDDPSNWTPTSRYAERFGSRLDLANIAREHVKIPAQVSRAKVLTDDFAPVEFLSTIELNNTGETR